MLNDIFKSPKLLLAGVFVAGLLSGTLGTALLLSEPAADSSSKDSAARNHQQGSGSGDKGTASPSKSQPSPPTVESLSTRAVAAELGELVGRETTDEEFDRLKDLVSKGAEFAPEETLDTALQIEDPKKKQYALERLFNYWMGKDQGAALTALDSIENLALRRFLFREAAKSLSDANPAAAVQLMETSRGFGDSDTWGRAFANWAKSDRDAAVEAMLATEHAGQRRTALRAIAEQLASSDLKGALEWAGTLDTADQDEAMKRILYRAARSEPTIAAKHLDKLEDGEFKLDLVGRAAREWAEDDIGAAMEWAEKLEGKVRDQALGQIASEVFETDPDGAEDVAKMITSAEGRRGVIGAIARLRVEADVEGAVRWIERLPEEDRASAWRGAAREWAELDPGVAGQFAAETDDPVIRDQLVEALSYSWPQHDPGAAAQWAQTLPGKSQSGAMSRVLDYWTRSKPEEAASFVTSSLDGELQGQMARRVAGRWMNEDAAAAAEWATTLEPGKAKADTYRDIAGHWLRRDATQASEWIGSLPESSERDSAVSTLIYSIEKEDPGAAAQWAETLSDPKAREGALQRILRRLQDKG